MNPRPNFSQFLLIGIFSLLAPNLFAQTPGENFALNKSTEQSSTYGLGVSSIAVDGDTDGSRGPWGNNPSIQHTQNEYQPWWQVDLGSSQVVEAVKIYNRIGGVALQARLRDVWLFISETPFDAALSLEDLKADPSITKEFFKGRAGDILEFSLAAQGQFVRIQLGKQGILHMAEVEVTGESGPTEECPEAEALMDLFNATQGPFWFGSDGGVNWGVGCPCENDWGGITCNSEGKVIELNLAENSIIGDIPASIGNLTALKKIDFGPKQNSRGDFLNRISSLPESIGNLTNLEVLNLNNNRIEEFPASIVNLQNLKELYFQANRITSFPESITQLVSLEKLWFGANVIFDSGNRIDLDSVPESIGNLINLREAGIGELTCIPNSMQTFCERGVVVNKFFSLFEEDSPTQSSVEFNRFCLDGTTACDPDNLPPTSEACPENEKEYNALVAFFNSTQGENGIDSWLRSDNWGLGCPCENDWFGITCNEQGKVIAIDLPFNNLRGRIPDEIEDLEFLERLNLYRGAGIDEFDENLIREISPAIGNLKNLEVLIIGGTTLSSIPSNLGDLVQLKSLVIWNNQLSSIPDFLSNLVNLENLDLALNQLSSLPSFISSFSKLKTLNLSVNQITELPPTLVNLENLETLTVFANAFECYPSSYQLFCEREVQVIDGFNQTPEFSDFCESGLFTCPSDGEPDPGTCAASNLALGQPASQSSTYGFGSANIAVDGDTDGSRGPWANASVQHTTRDNPAWWQVDLGQMVSIQAIKIYNRTDECCESRLRDFYVIASEIPIGGERTLSELLADPTVASHFYENSAPNEVEIPFETQGRYVQIQLLDAGFLHMAEVEVIGCPTSTQSLRLSNVYENEGPLLKENSLLKIYPNPFKHVITLELSAGLGHEGQLNVFNSLGQVIEHTSWKDRQYLRIGLDWPVGMYIVELRTGDKIERIQALKH